MEHNHKSHQAQNQSLVDEMEKRFEDLRTKIDYLQQSNDKFHQDKLHLIKQNEQLQLQVIDLENSLVDKMCFFFSLSSLFKIHSST